MYFLDDVPLPDGVALSGEDGLAERCLNALGVRGPVAPAAGVPLSIRHGGLVVDIWPGAAPAREEPIPGPLNDLIWGQGTSVLHLCDAARLPGFDGPDSVPGLEAVCLFDPPASTTLANVAPYLVQLEPDHWHTAHLFDDGGAFWSHWPRGAGIFLQTHGSLSEIRANLRRFTKIQDENAWVFLRLAEPRMLLPILLGLAPGLRGRLFEGVSSMIAIDPEEGLILRARCSDPAERMPIRVEPFFRSVLEGAVRARFAGDAERFCRETLIDRPVPAEPRRFTRLALTAAQESGLHDRQAVLLSVAAAWSRGNARWITYQGDILGSRDVTQIERGRALFRRAYNSDESLGRAS